MLKDMQPEELSRTIRVVYNGGVCLHPDVVQKIISKLSNHEVDGHLFENDLAQLTSREKEVLKLISKGFSNSEISAALFIVEGTVKNHVSNLLAKLEARDRTQLAILAQKIMT